MSERSVVVRLKAVIADYEAEMRKAEKATAAVGTTATKSGKEASAGLGGLADSARQNGQAWTTVGTALTGVGLAAAAGVGVAVAKFADFDRAMSGVQAATHESAAGMAQLREAAIAAGEDTQYSATEAAGAIENLAKAGVSSADILGGGLAGALDLAAAGELAVADAAEIAATALTQFNLQGSDVGHVADLLAAGAGKAQGSVQDMGMALKQTGLVADQTGLTIEETTGGLAAFASAGLIGSDSGTSFKSMLQRLTPQSAEAARAMSELGISAYDSQGQFIGLADFAGNLQTALADLTPEQRNSALATIFGSDAVRAANVLYNEGEAGIRGWIRAVDDQGFAAETAALRTDNLAGDIERLGGAFDSALIQTGSGANGVLRELVQGITGVVDAFNDLPLPLQQGALAIGGVTAGAGLLGGAVLLTVPKLVEFYDALGKMGPVGESAQAGLNKFQGALPTVAKVAAVAAALYAVGAAAAEFSNMSRDAVPGVEATTRALLDMADAGNAAAANDLFAEGVDFKTATGDAYGLAEAFRILTNESWQEGFNDTVGGFFGEVRASSQASEVFENIGTSLAGMVDSGKAELAAEQFQSMAAQLGLTGSETDRLMELMPAYGESLAGVENQSRLAGEATEGAANSTGFMTTSVEAAAKAAGEAAVETQKLIDTLTLLNEGALSVTRAEIGLQEAFNAARESAAANGATMDLNTEQGRNNTTAILGVADALSQKTLADYNEIAATSGVTEANRVLEASIPGLRQQFVDTMIQMGFNQEQAEAMAAQYLATPTDVKTQVALIGDAYARSQMQGLDADINGLNDKGVTVDVGLGPTATKVVNGTWRQGARVLQADGGVLDFYAQGGMRENHVAQIAPAGAWRVWAEEETGGEAYIPLAPSKRARSIDIWEEVGKRLGVSLQEFAQGGIVSRTTAINTRAPNLPPMRSTVGDMDDVFGQYALKLGNDLGDKLTAEVQKVLAEAAAAATSGGSSTGLVPSFLAAFNQYNAALGGRLSITSGFRSRASQERLYARWMARVPGQAPAAPPGRSNHERGLAIDHSPHSTASMRATAAGFGLRYPMSYEPWHVEPVGIRRAEGGILNPHVRDTGGPLLPGYTLNATGGTETVVPNSAFKPEVTVYVQAVPDGAWVQTQAKVVVDGAMTDAYRNARGNA